MEKKTYVVNLFGGPGTGKSTMMAAIFAELKTQGYDCEICPEFAKELVWENRLETFNDELYLFAKQNHRLFRLNGKVNVVITDRPLIMSIPYNRLYHGFNKIYEDLVKQTFDSYENINIFLDRVKEFNPNGRREDESTAKTIDREIENMLTSLGYKYLHFEGSIEKTVQICDTIKRAVSRRENKDINQQETDK